MISWERIPVSIASRVRSGRQSMARRRSSTDERVRPIGLPGLGGYAFALDMNSNIPVR